VQPDILFITTGAVALGTAAAIWIRAGDRPRRYGWLPVLLWALLGAGFLVQGFAPRLKIERNRFIIPAAAGVREGFDPAASVERERKMQILSGLLTGGAALGLACCYRGRFTRPG